MAWRRPLKLAVLWGFGLTLILAAVAIGVIQLALPWWASDADRVARLLSSRLHTPVTIRQALPQWSPRGPLIELRGVRFGADEGSALSIERAQWAIDFSGLVRPSRRFSEFRLQGLAITLSRQADGRWQVLGLPSLLAGEGEQPIGNVLRAVPAFVLRDSTLTVRAAPEQAGMTLDLRELRGIGDGRRWRGRVGPSGDTGADAGELLLGLDLLGDGSGRGWLAGRSLELPRWLEGLDALGTEPQRGAFDVQAWLHFDDEGVSDLQVEFDAGASSWLAPADIGSDEEVVGGGSESPRASVVDLPALQWGARWRRGVHEDVLLVEDIRFGHAADARSGSASGTIRDGQLRLKVRDLPLAPWSGVARLVDEVPASLRRWLADAQPEGWLPALDLWSDGSGVRQLAARVDAVEIAAAGGAPALDGVSLAVRGDADGAVLHPSGAIVLDWPGVFAAPVGFSVANGAVAAWRAEDGHWSLSFDELAVRGDDFAAAFAGDVHFPGDGAPRLDFGARVTDTGIEAVKAFWPLNRIPNTARWLNRSLQGGRIDVADVWIHGPGEAFPFDDGEGRFEAIAEVVAAGLDYHEEWPAISEADATLAFINDAMRVEAARVVASGIEVRRATAWVDDLKQPVLRIRADARAAGAQLLGFLEQTPIAERYGEHLDGMAIEGSPQVAVDLHLPLKRELGEAVVDGRVAFAGQAFTDARRDLAFGDVQGVLRFSRHGVLAEDLALTLAGEPARLVLRIGADTRDAGAELEAELDGRLSARALLGRIEALAPVVATAEGAADWRVRVHVPSADPVPVGAGPRPTRGETGAEGQGRVRVESDLEGIRLALPAPLAKDRDSRLPLTLDAGLASEARRVELRLGNLLQLHAQLPGATQPFAGAVALGGAEPEQLPASGLVVTGQVTALDLSGWLALAGGGSPASPDAASANAEIAWPQVALRAGELGVMGRAFREVDLQMVPGTEAVEVQLRGPDIEGTISWPAAAGARLVRGRFERLHVPAGPGAALGDTVAPTDIPALDVEAADLRVGVSRLGRTTLQAHPRGDHYRIERFTSRSPALALDASGDWRRRQGQDESDFDIELRADDLGQMLESFGFAGLIEGGATRATIDGSWAGSPAAFALDRLAGTLDIDVGAGRILDVDPGVGRLFGLLNLREIPRRLLLDFRDFFSQGMRFHSIAGRFTLEAGQAYTDDIVLKSPSADILVVGRTGLSTRDYDQTLEVTPRMSGTLPVVGAIAGGPAGAAAGLVVQGLFRIDEASRIIYRVTGPWDEPVIIKQEPGRDSARRTGAAPYPMEPST